MKRIRSNPPKELIAPKVLNKHTDKYEIAGLRDNQFVYIGRGSKWGNPYPINKNNTREDSILKYSEWLMLQPNLLDSMHELTGKHLVCFCTPLACHGDILLAIANPKIGFNKKTKKVNDVLINLHTGKIKRVTNISQKTSKQPIKRVKSNDVTKEQIEVLVDIHKDEERYISVDKENDRTKDHIANKGNWSKMDTLWHYGSELYNKETFEETQDRIRLYYEWKHSFPNQDLYEPTMGDIFDLAFSIGVSYGKDHINKDKIDKWAKERAERLKGQKFNKDDIPI